jgi:hypothetical protein
VVFLAKKYALKYPQIPHVTFLPPLNLKPQEEKKKEKEKKSGIRHPSIPL